MFEQLSNFAILLMLEMCLLGVLILEVRQNLAIYWTEAAPVEAQVEVAAVESEPSPTPGFVTTRRSMRTRRAPRRE
jgi:hypothetical protein